MTATTATDPACGTTGCEAHDGECRNGWAAFDGPARRTLKPAPVSTRQFSYDPSTTTFSAEASSTNGFGRVYDDACDLGLTLVSSRTGREVVFVIADEYRDAEGDLTHWLLKSVEGNGRYHLQLWND